MTVTLTLMDGRTISVPVDSASTSGEICQMLSQKIQLKDSFGFSVYVALYEKVSRCRPGAVGLSALTDRFILGLLDSVHRLISGILPSSHIVLTVMTT